MAHKLENRMDSAAETNFIEITKIKEFPMNIDSPMSISFSYPLLGIVVSSDKIITFDFETRATITLERKANHEENVVMCSSITQDKTHIATGHSDGEIVLWSIQSRTMTCATKLSDPITYIAFGSSTFAMLHSDSNGTLCKSLFSQNIFKKSVSTQVLHSFDQPLTALAVQFSMAFVSTSMETLAYSLSPDFQLVWADNSPSSCFAFLENNEGRFIARGVGHNVFLSMIDGSNKRIIEFSHTPSVVSVLNINSVLVLFNGFCEMSVGSRRFRRAVPQGRSLAHKDRIFIVGSDLVQLSLVSLQQRVDNYIKEGNWRVAFEQISNPDDVSNFPSLLNSYVQSNSFDASYLLSIVDRFGVVDYIVQMMFPSKKEEILLAFVDKIYTNWPLTISFIFEITKICPDEKLIPFLGKIEIHLDWLQQIFTVCYNKGYYDTMISIALEYCSDYYLALKLSYHDKKIDKVYGLLKDILSLSSAQFINDGLAFLLESDLSFFLSNNQTEAQYILFAYFDIVVSKGGDITNYINHFCSFMSEDSILWIPLSTTIIDKRIILNTVSFQNSIRHIFSIPNEHNVNNRQQLFAFLLSSNQITDLRLFLGLARTYRFNNIQFDIIALLHDAEELISFIIENKLQSFSDSFNKVVPDITLKKKAYERHCRILLSVNPDEFCVDIWAFGDFELIHNVYHLVKESKSHTWHLLKRLFTHSEFFSVALEDEFTSYITFLSYYYPNNLLDTLKQMPNIPVEKALQICQTKGIIDAFLFLCQLTHDMDKALEFGTVSLQNSLMTDQDPSVVTQIITFLSGCSSYPEFRNLCDKFMESFQLPLFAFLSTPEKLSSVTSLLSQYVQSMILIVDPVFLAEQFSKHFSFLPFKDSRPILKTFFLTLNEKNQFSHTYSQIVKHESVEKQINHIKSKSRGAQYTALKCISCGLPFTHEPAVAAPCGHTFHFSCTSNAWCPVCNSPFTVPKITPVFTQIMGIIDKFEEIVDQKKSETVEQIEPSDIPPGTSLSKPRVGNDTITLYK